MAVQEADLALLLVGIWIGIVGEMVRLSAVVIVFVSEVHVFVVANDVAVLFAVFGRGRVTKEYETSDERL